MSKSYRIRTELGINKQIQLNLDQDYDFLEVLSLKFRPEELYPRSCSDFGVITGRVIANGGYGVPNAKISVFIPLTDADALDPVISVLYPYKSVNDVNEDGYRYNLLPYTLQHAGHTPTGTFPSLNDTLVNNTVVGIYDKYYKFTVKTNQSGDYMIFGVPLGNQTVVMDLDLSDMGPFSLSPQDLIRMGRATESQVDGNRFKSSENIDSLPQIVNQVVDISVESFWGQEDLCQTKIHRLDFDLRKLGIEIEPTAVFMGSMISNSEKSKINKRCKPPLEGGNLCELTTGPGQILAIRQTIFVDSDQRPVLEEFKLENGGRVIDEDGTWVTDLPMNLDYVITNEFGETILSPTPNIGIPSSAKYRFKIKWQQPDTLDDGIKRGYYLVPNIKENYDGFFNNQGYNYTPDPNSNFVKSYAFSLDWNDYGDTGTTIGVQMIDEAINCIDRFFVFKYKKVYTVSQLIDQYHNGSNRARFIGIKEITDNKCETENNKFPITDGVRNFNIIYFVLSFFLYIITALLLFLMFPIHILAVIIRLVAWLFNSFVIPVCDFLNNLGFGFDCPEPIELDNLLTISLPVITYPDCDVCECKQDEFVSTEDWVQQNASTIGEVQSSSFLANLLNANDLINPCGLNNNNLIAYKACLSGNIDTNKYWKRTPFWYSFVGSGYDVPGTFGGDTPIYENINRYNLKDKYFDTQIDGINGWTNGSMYTWGGQNRISVAIEPGRAANIGRSHKDNVFVLLVDPNKLNQFTSGKVITFQDPELSIDPNVGNLVYNFTPGVRNITVNYANPISPQATWLNETYEIDLTGGTQEYLFPTDLEYFQVITGLTVNQFEQIRNPSGYEDFWDAFLKRNASAGFSQFKPNVGEVSQTLCPFSVDCAPATIQSDCGNIFTETCNNIGTYNITYGNSCQPIALEHYESFSGMGIVIMVRGVDVNSQRVNIDYGLGRVFGYGSETEPGLTVSGEFKLNIPIQPKLNLPRHNEITINLQDSNGGMVYNRTYYTDWSQSFTAFTTSAHTYYSALDGSNVNTFIVDPNRPRYTRLSINTLKDNPAITVQNNRLKLQTIGVGQDILRAGGAANYGYDFGGAEDYIEGGSFIYKNTISLYPWVGTCSQLWPTQTANVQVLGSGAIGNCNNIEHSYNGSDGNEPYFPVYFAPSYPRDGSVSMLIMGVFTPGTENFLVFRTDRLPTSTCDDKNLNNYFAAQANNKFCFFFFNDDGSAISAIGVESVNLFDGENDFSTDLLGSNLATDALISSFSCESLVDLDCYQEIEWNGTTINVPSPTSDCNELGGNQLVKNGCYVLVKRAVIDLNLLNPNNDFAQIGEWAGRVRVNLAACLNIFSHTFVNSWINGTLYMFNIKNNRFQNNELVPYSEYCHDVVLLHPTTNEYFYRSSPYNYSNNTFIGQPSPDNNGIGQVIQLLFPTTIMDLGPVNDYTNQLVLGPEYEGYVMNNLPSTTYQDITDLFLMFMVSRQMNSNFLNQAFSATPDGGAKAYFRNERANHKDRMDGDYIQSVQINSQFGVFEYSFDQYNDNDFYIGNDTSGKPIIGLFFKSNRQLRDLITPRRLIFDESTTNIISQPIPVFTQEIPHYEWTTRNDQSNVIFGNENNDWNSDTLPVPSKFYQQQDRTSQNNYFIGSNQIVSALTGYITQTYSDGTPNPTSIGGGFITQVGSPWYFYFGLKKGASSMDKFLMKYIE